jgi:predicted transcriptional regulator with HTH domain
MRFEDSELHRSLRRSRIRARIILALRRHGELHVEMLAQKVGTSRIMVRQAMHGQLPYYRRDLSPVGMGLVARRTRSGLPAYRLTPAGEHVAEELAATYRDTYPDT